MQISEAQRQVRDRYRRGSVGQLVAAAVWLAGALLATYASPKAAILATVIGGVFIFPLTQAVLRLGGRAAALPRAHPMNALAMQTAFVLPVSMLLLIPVCDYRLALFFPALMILLGAHYFPFAFLYGMRTFLVLGGLLILGGVAVAVAHPAAFACGAWVAVVLLAGFGLLELRAAARREGAEEAGSGTRGGGALLQ